MKDIYEILAKHFQNDTTADEEKLIENFKVDNPGEYSALKLLWFEERVDVREFDPENGWRMMLAKFELQKQTKVIPIRRNYTRIASVAAILIIGLVLTIYLLMLNQETTYIIEAGPQERNKMVLLSDGSTLWLNASSSIAYTSSFQKRKREVKLRGEAFFEVVPDPESPFTVETTYSDITVLGTSFDVNAGELQTEVVVKTGKVQVSSLHSSDKTLLLPNQMAVVSKTKFLSHLNTDPNYLSWQTGVFKFENTPIIRVLEDLNSYYSEQFSLDTAFGSDCKLTAEFNQLTIGQVIEILEITCDIKITNEGNKYFLKNNNATNL